MCDFLYIYRKHAVEKFEVIEAFDFVKIKIDSFVF